MRAVQPGAGADVLTLPARVDVREVGPRDGLQIEEPVPLAGKLAMLEALARTGVRRIEATAFVSQRAVPAMADAAEVAVALHRWPDVAWSALVPNIRGAQRALDAGLVDLELVVSASQSHSLANSGMSRADALALVGDVADLVHGVGGRLEVVIAVAWDCPFEGRTPQSATVEVARAAMAAGADSICLGDTIGTTTPVRVVTLAAAVADVLAETGAPSATPPGTPSGSPAGTPSAVAMPAMHFHDTRGTGQANVLAALQAGVTQLDASVGGLGGCPFAPGASGNIATEELTYLLEECGVETGIDLDALLAAARVTEEVVGHPLPSSLYRAGGRSRPLGPVSQTRVSASSDDSQHAGQRRA